MVTCWALLVLTMFPERAIAGRYVPGNYISLPSMYDDFPLVFIA